MCSIGVDIAQGGTDNTMLSRRYDHWFAELVEKPGKLTPTGKEVAAEIFKYRANRAQIVIDMGGGYGGGTMMKLEENLEFGDKKAVVGFTGNAKSTARTKDRLYSFKNKRVEAWWKFREALDPEQEGGARIALPPDSEMAAQLVAPRWGEARREIFMEDKKETKKRLNIKLDKADAIIMAYYGGPKWATHHDLWRRALGSQGRPGQVNRGYAHRKGRR